jgi:hypothetical protein
MYYPIQLKDQKLIVSTNEIQNLTFKDLGLKEADIEEFLSDNLDLLVEDETLLIVGQQVRNVQNGRSDLIAVDEEGNLVLIEIKRDLIDMKNRKEPMEFQAIRYAANIAKITDVDSLVTKIYAPYIEKKRDFSQNALTPSEQAKRNLDDFLQRNDSERTFNQKQKIILVASEFDEQTLSACAWLSNNHVDISCITIEPKKFKDELFLDINKVLPLQKVEEFYVDVAVSSSIQKPAKVGTSTKKRYLPRMKELIEWEIIVPGQTIAIKNYENSDAKVLDESNVLYNGQQMTYNEWGKTVTGWSAMSVYEWIVVEGQSKTLHEMRLEKLNELDQ